jgi:L-methionine (R)-S-oxide reductase
MKTINQELLIAQLRSLVEGEPNHISNLANASALFFQEVPDINWAGFYLCEGDELVLGPFQGKLACTRIPFGKGVCGTAAARRQTQRVTNVDQFPGHIACDTDSRSEIVVPLIKDSELLGVLDIDSPLVERFTAADQELLEACVQVLIEHW